MKWHSYARSECVRPVSGWELRQADKNDPDAGEWFAVHRDGNQVWIDGDLLVLDNCGTLSTIESVPFSVVDQLREKAKGGLL